MSESATLSPIATIFRSLGRNLILRGLLELVIGILLIIEGILCLIPASAKK